MIDDLLPTIDEYPHVFDAIQFDSLEPPTLDECPHVFDAIHFDPLELFPSSEDINSLTKQIESLNIEVNTQGLKSEVERLKRQRLGINLKQVKQLTIPMRKTIAHLQQENNKLRMQIHASSETHHSERARSNMWIHSGMSRIHQILIGIIPRIPMTPSEHTEAAQLTYELLRIAQQIVPQPRTNQID